ncbi:MULTISPECIES: autotransporter outer membrane beta-barrel domain-containing protein [Rhodomicrobium]|uniref:autotransporter outer membrane beta-barrel domain-containing protein n=1 Tax=Rhodomicrobium TaxID=1068 RepID=UPI000B4BCCD5|nr:MULTISPECIES: autotransporter outer membrane beta-barrel domain-containing protein [Rhodomicrobium]
MPETPPRQEQPTLDCSARQQARAALGGAASNSALVAAGVTQDIIAAALDGDLQPEVTAFGPIGSGSPGQTSSSFMVSGYKFLSHDGFSSTSSGQSSFKNPEFDEQNYGLTVGLRFDGSALFDASPRSVTFGVIGNYTHTEIDVGRVAGVPGPSESGEATVESWTAGGFGLVTDGTRYGLLTVTGTFGAPETSGKVLPLSAEFNNFALATSAVAGIIVPLGDSKLDLRGGVNYIHATSDDYVDSGGSRFTDGRMEEFSGSISARLFQTVQLEDAVLRPFVQGGLNHRFHYENELTVDGEDFSFDDADTSIFARAGIDFDIGSSTQAYLAVRGDASEDFRAIAAQVGLTFKLD